LSRVSSNSAAGSSRRRSRPGLNPRLAVADSDGANRDAEVEIAGEVDVADRAGVNVPPGRLELGEDLALRESWEPPKRAGRETGDQRIEMVLILGERAVHRRHQVHDVRVALEPHVLRHADGAVLADTAEIVAAEIDEHHVLGTLFFVALQLFAEAQIFILAAAARAACRRWDASPRAALPPAPAFRATSRRWPGRPGG
jgi:hypothetical protein